MKILVSATCKWRFNGCEGPCRSPRNWLRLWTKQGKLIVSWNSFHRSPLEQRTCSSRRMPIFKVSQISTVPDPANMMQDPLLYRKYWVKDITRSTPYSVPYHTVLDAASLTKVNNRPRRFVGHCMFNLADGRYKQLPANGAFSAAETNSPLWATYKCWLFVPLVFFRVSTFFFLSLHLISIFLHCTYCPVRSASSVDFEPDHASRIVPHQNASFSIQFLLPVILNNPPASSEISRYLEMCDYFKNYYIYSSCSQPDSHFLRTSLDGSKANRCPDSPHDRFIIVVGKCHLCVRWFRVSILARHTSLAASIRTDEEFLVSADWRIGIPGGRCVFTELQNRFFVDTLFLVFSPPHFDSDQFY